jgi:hypothetical protein
LQGVKVVHRVQIAVPEILIQRTVEGIRAALDHGVKLTAGGVAELGAELILQQGEALHRVIRDHNEISRDRLVVVVHAFHREVIVVGTLAAHGWAGTCPQRARLGNAGTQKRKV